MAQLQKFYTNTYRDSVALMQISAEISELSGISQASLIMATAANIALLNEIGLIGEFLEPRNNDLLFAAEGDNDEALQLATSKVEAKLNEVRPGSDSIGLISDLPRSIQMGFDQTADSNLALISCPSEYATAEALKALKLGLNVMLFSDNVRIEDEIFLKREAKKKDLLFMGPDCGTAILNGVPLGFANNVTVGNIGIVAASGTGLQQVSCLIDRWGGGISQAIGTGGRDLSEKVGGTTMIAGIDALSEDTNTDVIVLISKPPSPEVAMHVLKKATSAGKPVVVNFLGNTLGISVDDPLHEAKDLEATAYAAIKLAGIEITPPKRHLVTPEEVTILVNQLPKGRRYLRGLYTGGTFAYEAMYLLTESLGPLHSATSPTSEYSLKDPWKSLGHTVLDLGNDIYTRGRPHPMIDHRLRNDRIIQEAQDPQTAIILLDLVLGYGSHSNPAPELALTLARADETAKGQGPLVIGFVCGTTKDPQSLEKQKEILSDSGVLLMESNAQAIRLTADILSGVSSNGN